MTAPANHDYGGNQIPPEVYAVGFGWDPTPEVQRLLFLARETGSNPRSALELGCGTGRILAAFGEDCPNLAGIELDPAHAAYADAHTRATVRAGDMTDFDLNRTFDLVYCSANTIRHILDNDANARLARCVSRHLAPAGVAIFDLELGPEHIRNQLGHPAHWSITHGDTTVDVTWDVIEAAADRCTIEWCFVRRYPEPAITWREQYPLRVCDGPAFCAPLEAAGLTLAGVYELREPYLLPVDPARAAGRHLVAFRQG